MTDLRKAAEMALECIDYHWDNPDSELEQWPYVVEAKQALRQALAQPQKEWVGLSDDEREHFRKIGFVGVLAVESKLKEKNT